MKGENDPEVSCYVSDNYIHYQVLVNKPQRFTVIKSNRRFKMKIINASQKENERHSIFGQVLSIELNTYFVICPFI